MSHRVELQHRAFRVDLSTIVLDDPGTPTPGEVVVVTSSGAGALRDALSFDAPPATGAPFADAFAAPRWSLVLLQVARLREDIPREALAYAAGLCARSSTFREAVFASWQLGGIQGVVALILAPDGG